MRTLALRDVAAGAGEEIGVSDWLQIDQARVDRFADVTGDHQWIHVDVARAERDIGGPIAHGFLTLSLLPVLSEGLLTLTGVSRSLNYGLDRVRFINPVRVGRRVRVRQKLLAAEPKAGGVQLRNQFTVEIEGEDKPACVAEMLVVHYA